MSRPGHPQGLDRLAVLLILTGGLITLAAHPVKTYRLVRHRRGWYE